MKKTERDVATAKQHGQGKTVRGVTSIKGPLGQILRHADEVRATDVHIELAREQPKTRYRINGTLQEEGPKLTRAACATAISAAKRLAGLKSAGLGLPQSGRFQWGSGKREFLISVAPCLGGENVTLRLLWDNLPPNLQQLGIEESVVGTLRRWLGRSHGVVIVSGVTGSGKTTTLYALLNELNTPANKVVSLEEPVAYRIDGVTHIEVDPGKGMDFATALRCALTQDADVILVGELKNAETAEVTFKAALTGHTVLTTMHAEDAPATVDRLRDIGIEPKFINQALVGVVSQRLARKICDKCKVVHKPTAMERKAVLKGKTGGRFYRGKGCAHCGGTGYRGRAAVFELFELDKNLKAMILRRASVDELRRQAKKSGIVSLSDAALAKARAGITTLSEVMT